MVIDCLRLLLWLFNSVAILLVVIDVVYIGCLICLIFVLMVVYCSLYFGWLGCF